MTQEISSRQPTAPIRTKSVNRTSATMRDARGWTVAPMLARRWLSPAGAGVGDYAVAIPPPMVFDRVLELSVEVRASPVVKSTAA